MYIQLDTMYQDNVKASVVLSYVIPASPPKAPASLNCTCVVLQPGLPHPAGVDQVPVQSI